MFFACSCGSLNSRTHGEGHELPDTHTLLANDNQARDNAKGKLRGDKPPPIDLFIEQWIYESENAVE
jgi:hypothetical protein